MWKEYMQLGRRWTEGERGRDLGRVSHVERIYAVRGRRD